LRCIGTNRCLRRFSLGLLRLQPVRHGCALCFQWLRLDDGCRCRRWCLRSRDRLQLIWYRCVLRR
jgi:hypothetical protein